MRLVQTNYYLCLGLQPMVGHLRGKLQCREGFTGILFLSQKTWGAHTHTPTSPSQALSGRCNSVRLHTQLPGTGRAAKCAGGEAQGKEDRETLPPAQVMWGWASAAALGWAQGGRGHWGGETWGGHLSFPLAVWGGTSHLWLGVSKPWLSNLQIRTYYVYNLIYVIISLWDITFN